MDWLRGKKTFIIAILMSMVGIVNLLTGDIALPNIMALLASDDMRMVFDGMGLSFLRMGVAKAGG